MKITECMIAWTPRHPWNRDSATYGQVKVGPWPDRSGWTRNYSRTCGACFTATHGMAEWQRIAMLFVDFNTLVARDNIDPTEAHRAFLAIDEYRWLISPDLKGATYPDEEEEGQLFAARRAADSKRIQARLDALHRRRGQ